MVSYVVYNKSLKRIWTNVNLLVVLFRLFSCGRELHLGLDFSLGCLHIGKLTEGGVDSWNLIAGSLRLEEPVLYFDCWDLDHVGYRRVQFNNIRFYLVKRKRSKDLYFDDLVGTRDNCPLT